MMANQMRLQIEFFKGNSGGENYNDQMKILQKQLSRVFELQNRSN